MTGTALHCAARRCSALHGTEQQNPLSKIM
jgi:hypothetical protein